MYVVTDSPTTWTQLITDNFISLRVTDAVDDFVGSLERCDLGGAARLSAVQTHRSRVHREKRGVRADALDDLLLLTPLDGRAVVRQEGSECTVGPGAVSVHVADRPYELRFDRPTRVLVLQVPRRVVPSAELVSPERRRNVLGGAMVRVFCAFATETLAAADELSSRERAELGVTAAELAVSVLGAGRADFAASSDTTSYLRISAQAFIQTHISDPELTPSVVARSQLVSLRSLQLAFAVAESTPAAYIRAERLRLAQRLLGDPRHATRSVAQIAHAVGYSDATVFIRAFKRAFGTTPAAWRAGMACASSPARSFHRSEGGA